MSAFGHKDDEDEDEAETKISLKDDAEEDDQERVLNDDEDVCTVVSKHDYRLDFTEVEGALAAVPEEGMFKSAPETAEIAQVEVEVENNVPESNASDIYSDCSYQTDQHYRSSYWTSEPLTAKQQVALWLTRTSMSDLSSMPSLRSLVFPKSSSKSRFHSHTKTFLRPASESAEKRVRQNSGRNKAEIHRNFSTKSLINGYGIKDRNDSVSPTPMRKCETVIALSGMNVSAGNSATTGQRSRRSSLNLFKKLSRRGGSRKSSGAGVASGEARAQFGPSFSITSNDAFGESGRETPLRGIRPTNRLRSTTSSLMCSRCTSVVASRMTSRAPSHMSLMTSQYHLPTVNHQSFASLFKKDLASCGGEPCKICLENSRDMVKLQQCSCTFCRECLIQYLTFEVMSGAYDISCPDADCETKGILQMSEMEAIVGKEVMDKHRAFKLNTEVSLDKNRAWCPRPDCGTICHVCAPSSTLSLGVPVQCPSCDKEFCSLCQSNWHSGKTCQQHGKDLVANNRLDMTNGSDVMINFDRFGGDIKPCPMCRVPIERDAGCAQMMCKRCKHVFCWFCLTSLDEDFLLRHYDSGECKGRLGHSRVSVLWHRAQVIGIFAGFGILLLVASPLLLLAAPCIICCRCKGGLDKMSEDKSSSEEEAGDAQHFVD